MLLRSLGAHRAYIAETEPTSNIAMCVRHRYTRSYVPRPIKRGIHRSIHVISDPNGQVYPYFKSLHDVYTRPKFYVDPTYTHIFVRIVCTIWHSSYLYGSIHTLMYMWPWVMYDRVLKLEQDKQQLSSSLLASPDMPGSDV